MVLAKFLCQAMACNFVILEKKIHKEKKTKRIFLKNRVQKISVTSQVATSRRVRQDFRKEIFEG